MENDKQENAVESLESEQKEGLFPSSLGEFQSEFDKKVKTEEKVRLSLDFMRHVLSRLNPPRFKEFWESKKICLPLFKELQVSSEKAQLWGEYVEISSEARRVKDLLDEQSGFAVEQIDIALTSIEKDIASLDVLVMQVPQSFVCDLFVLNGRGETYDAIQREIYILNMLAAKLQAFRSEVIKTEMRIRFKNQFFDRLSKIGDLVFPKRKELIQNISSMFIADVLSFCTKEEGRKNYDRNSLLDAKDGIKEFQNLAKKFSLDTKAFNESRIVLGKCWDALKQHEELLREDFKQKLQVYKKNFELVMDKIKPLAEKCQKEGCQWEEVSKLTTEVSHFMRHLELGRDEVRALQDEIQKAQMPVLERIKKEQQEYEKKSEDVKRQKREKFEALKQEIEAVLQKPDQFSVEELTQMRNQFLKQVETLSLSVAEKGLLVSSLKELRDAILIEKEKAWAKLSKDELNSLANLRSLLEERKLQRAEIKAQLENYRRELASSGFDFNRAMQTRELIEEEKQRQERLNAAIEEIEEQIVKFEETC